MEVSEKQFIVADAGGSTTAWRVFDKGEIIQYTSQGFNAYIHAVDEFVSHVQGIFKKKDISNFPLFFYAAGVETGEQKEKISAGLGHIFNSTIEINNDLLAVARALCGTKKGYLGILGTGANACYYDGTHVDKVSASLGYILGDEGSGAYLGKKLIAAIYRNQLPNEIIDYFQDKYPLSSGQLIRQLYNHSLPNTYLASFAPFLLAYRNHPMVFNLIAQSFHDFFDAFFAGLSTDLPLHFSGSIAHYFSDILLAVGKERGYFIQTIVQSPIAGLVLYHTENE